MFSINSRISDEKTMAILRTNIIADIMINAVSQTNQMEKNFWFNIFGGKTHKLLYVCWSPPVPCLNCKKSISITIIIIKFMQYNQYAFQFFYTTVAISFIGFHYQKTFYDLFPAL